MSWYEFYYEPTRPREVKGGIKAVSKRGRFGTTWWGQRWIDTLEGFDVGARLGRGKSYARSGQVLSIDVEEGRVRASVQGSRARPYAVTIALRAYEAVAWEALARSLRKQPFFAAKLLAGEMPAGFEAACADAGLALFPERGSDLETDCSCPDWSNPCKHIAAVYYLLAEEFDRDPFLLFQLRGMTREGLLTQLLGSPKTVTEDEQLGRKPAAAVEPLTPDARFWQASHLPDGFFGTVRTPPASAALVKRLGKFPFWRAEEPLVEALEPVYKNAAAYGLNLFESLDSA